MDNKVLAQNFNNCHLRGTQKSIKKFQSPVTVLFKLFHFSRSISLILGSHFLKLRLQYINIPTYQQAV